MIRVGNDRWRETVLVADVPNRNRRLYPRAVLEANCQKLAEIIARRGLVGQMGFPDDSVISFANASHLVTALEWEGDNLVAEIEVLDTPAGRVLKSVLETTPSALRPHGVGNGQVRDDGVLVIGDSYKMISISVIPLNEAA